MRWILLLLPIMTSSCVTYPITTDACLVKSTVSYGEPIEIIVSALNTSTQQQLIPHQFKHPLMKNWIHEVEARIEGESKIYNYSSYNITTTSLGQFIEPGETHEYRIVWPGENIPNGNYQLKLDLPSNFKSVPPMMLKVTDLPNKR